MAVVARLDPSCEAAKGSDFVVVAGVLKVRVQSQRYNTTGPIVPILLPSGGSCLHSSVVVCFVRKTEITLILISKDGR